MSLRVLPREMVLVAVAAAAVAVDAVDAAVTVDPAPLASEAAASAAPTADPGVATRLSNLAEAPHVTAHSPLHAHLVSSVPAAGDTVRGPLDLMRLVFSEPIEEAFSEIVLTGGEAGAERATLSPVRDPDNVRTLLAELPALPDGGYRAAWRIVSADGHPVAGSFVFYVARDGAGAAGTAPTGQGGPPPSTLGEPAPPDTQEGDLHGAPAGSTGEPPVVAALLRGSSLGALMAVVGLLAMLAWIAPGPAPRLGRVALGLAVVTPVLLAGDFVLWFQHASRSADFNVDRLGAALHTQSGAVAALRLGLSALALWALALTRRRRLAAALAGLALLLTGATGHPAAIHAAFAVPAKAVHLIAASLWLGGLLVLLLGDRGDERFRSDARRVSTVALASVVTIAATGALQALLFLPSPADLVRSTYGLMVLGKLAGLGVLVAFGARNRYRLLPPLAQGAPPSALRRSVGAETAVMAAVILLAAFLAYIPPPTPGADRATAAHADGKLRGGGDVEPFARTIRTDAIDLGEE